MDPRILDPAQWERLAWLVIHLFVFTALAVNAPLAALLARAVAPTLLPDVADPGTRARQISRALYLVVFWGSAALAAYAFGVVVALAVDLLEDYFPRFLI